MIRLNYEMTLVGCAQTGWVVDCDRGGTDDAPAVPPGYRKGDARKFLFEPERRERKFAM
jgi:hypothetical protein